VTETRKQSRIAQALIFVLCLAGSGGYVRAVINTYLARDFAAHSGQASIERAVALAPRSADYHDLLCRGMMFTFQEPGRAVGECKKASELNPYSSSIWLDLAQAYYLIDNKELNHGAVRMALAVDPTTPDTIWSAANFFLAQGETAEALKEFSIVLKREPSLAPASLNVCWRSLHDVNQIQEILPPNPAVYLDFIHILDSAGEFDQANQVWSSLMQIAHDVDYRNSLFYVDDLLKARRVGQAVEAWKQLSERSMMLQAYAQPGSLIMDGSFAREILNAGFGWRYDPNSQIAVALDTVEFHGGSRSLRLSYSGNGGDGGIRQYIAVKPESEYRLSAWVKSDDLTTANGPMLAIVDAYSHDLVASTQETVGRSAWHRVETEFKSGPAVNLIMLTILRRPEETSIRGTFWVDDIQLHPVAIASVRDGKE